MVVIRNVGNGRIEVKSWKNSEVVVTGTKASEKIAVETEQAGDRIDVTSSIVDSTANARGNGSELSVDGSGRNGTAA